MISDALNSTSSEPIEYDVCIIGAGPAGITLALAFDKTRFRVCLLEAGGMQPSVLDDEHPYQGINIGRPYDMARTRLRFFGGTSNHWGGWCRPLDDIDFMARDYIPLSGWPIRRQNLLPYYENALDICEVNTGGIGLAAFEEQHKDESFIHNKSDFLINKSFFLSLPTRFGTRYESVIRASKQIDCFLNSTVVELMQPSNEVETVVVFSGGKDTHIKARYIVIATGAIEAPRLLLHSNRHQPQGLGNGGDFVGRCFSDHLGWITATVALPDSNQYYRRKLSKNPSVQEIPQLSFDQQTILKNRLVNFGITLYKTKMSTSQATDIGGSLAALGRWDAKSSTSELLFRFECTPNPDSRVTLGAETDAYGMRRVILDWQVNDIEIESLYRITWMLNKLMGEQHMGRVKAQVIPLSEPKLRASYQAHHLGTTRMALDERQGVVDLNCQVHGSKNLFIAGSAVFPTFGFANPTLTIVALASRLAEHIRNRLWRNG